MTTEIAVLNRLGVALATDSAVTISGSGKTKVFDSADKLVELSCEHPVAIMVNGNMDCFGVPWEIVVKDFRAVEGTIARTAISDWLGDFLKFAELHKNIGTGCADGYVDYVANLEANIVKDTIVDKFWNEIKPSNKNAILIDLIATSISQDRVSELAGYPPAESLHEHTVSEVMSLYRSRIETVINREFSPIVLQRAAVEALTKQVAAALLVMIPNDFSTGLVVAGYGRDETFPSLCSVDVEGLLFDN